MCVISTKQAALGVFHAPQTTADAKGAQTAVQPVHAVFAERNRADRQVGICEAHPQPSRRGSFLSNEGAGKSRRPLIFSIVLSGFTRLLLAAVPVVLASGIATAAPMAYVGNLAEMAEDAVGSLPVSSPNSPLTGK